MTTARGTIRSTETREAEASGNSAGEARAAAIGQLDLNGFELQQATTVMSKATEETAIRAVARSIEARPHEASGSDYRAAPSTASRSQERVAVVVSHPVW